MTDCAGRSGILINEAISAPLSTAVGWQPCTTAAGAITYSFPLGTPGGEHLINLWVKNTVGIVIAAPFSIPIDYDYSLPKPPVVQLSSPSKTNSTSVTLSATSCEAPTTKILINEGGQPLLADSGWQTCATTPGALSYTLNSAAQTNHFLKAWAKDKLGNVGPLPTPLIVLLDTTVPVVSTFQINGGVGSSSNQVPLNIVATDPGTTPSGIVAYRISLSSSFSGVGWSQGSFPTQYSFPYITGAIPYTLYLQIQDAAGNISTTSSASITVTIGPPPTILAIQPDGQTPYSGVGQAIRMAWKITVNSGGAALSPAGINIFYSTDNGATLQAWPSGSSLNPSASADCTGGDTTAGATGCKLLNLPAPLVAPQTFIVVIKITDLSGSSAQAASVVMNAPSGLRLIAGNNSSVLGGAAAGTALKPFGGLARDPSSGDIYFTQGCQILIIPASSGIVSAWAGSATNCVDSGDAAGAGIAIGSLTFDPHTFFGGNAASIAIDSHRNVYWGSTAGIWKFDRAQNKAFIWVAAKNGPFSTADGTDRLSFDFNGNPGQLAIGAGDTLYFSQTNYVTISAGFAPTYGIFYRLEGNTVRYLGGGLTNGATPTASGDPNTVTGLLSMTVSPGQTLAQDRIFVSQCYPANAVWELLPNPTFPAGKLNLVKSGAGPFLRYLKSRNLLVTETGNLPYGFLDPDSPGTSYSTYPIADSIGYGVREIVDDGSGGFYYLASGYHVISYVDSGNSPTTFAGIAPDAGDGGPATLAQLRSPGSLAIDSVGNLAFTDFNNGRVRKIDTSGTINAISAIPALNDTFVSSISGNILFTEGYSMFGGPGKAIDATNACVVNCGSGAANYLGDLSSMPGGKTPATLSGQGTSPLGIGTMMFANDGTDLYIWITESLGYNYRTAIKKITAGNVLTHVAGTLAVPTTNSLGLVAGQSLNGHDAGYGPMAGQGGGTFYVRNRVVYMLDGYQIWSSDLTAPTPVWTLQVSSAGGIPQSMLAVPTGDIYFTRQADAHVYKKVYNSTGTGAVTTPVDFTGSLTTPWLRAYDPVTANSVIITDGNQLYRYTDAVNIP